MSFWRLKGVQNPILDAFRFAPFTRMTKHGVSCLEGQRAISGAKMSEESTLRNAQGDIVSDEFFREEIGCGPTKGNVSLGKRDSPTSVGTTSLQTL